jgi:thermitase
MRRGNLTLRFEILETRTLLSVTPNDTYYPQQWGLNNSNNVDVDAPQAWDLNTGSSSVIVAAIGITGVDLTNPDLTNRIWTNPNPNSDPNYPGAVHGWNFITNSPTITDTDGHDTNVAGIVAAQTNNSQGIAGVTWGCPFMPLVANTYLEDAAVVNFAVAHGAKVINMSFAYSESSVHFSSDLLYQAIQNAASSGVVCVAAAGNGGTSGSTSNPGQDLATLSPTVCPAAFRLPNMINVAAVDSSGNLTSFSNYGATTVDLGAPGFNIYTRA